MGAVNAYNGKTNAVLNKETGVNMEVSASARVYKSKNISTIVVGDENYGEGSSREHAALAPKYLGVKAIVAKSFARIHMANLVNFGILPLTFANKKDYLDTSQGDVLDLDIRELSEHLCIKNLTKGTTIDVTLSLSDLEKSLIKAGGKLAAIKAKQK